MASSTKLSSSETKNVFLQHISTDIKGIQDAQCNVSTHMDVLRGSSKHAQLLCDHLDHILMHGLYRSDDGYWPCVIYFTHKITVSEINSLLHVTTNIGRGRAWLYLSLNEQSVECYLRMFIDNQQHLKLFYAKESFIRDVERLSVLLTLISGLDFVSFDLSVDESYLNVAASSSVSNSGIDFSVKPSFVASVTPDIARKKDFTHSVTEASTITHPSSPMNSTQLTSSLPTKLTCDLSNSERTEEEEVKQQQTQGEESVSLVIPDIPRVDPEVSIDSKVKSEQIDSVDEQIEERQSKQPTRLSFLDRYNQLADQEEEKTSELVLVTRKKRPTKGKKKKKRKDVEVVPSKNEMEKGSSERAGSPQLLIESVKENQPPVAEDSVTNNDSSRENEYVVPNISSVNESIEIFVNDVSTLNLANTMDSLTGHSQFDESQTSSTNPFDTDSSIEEIQINEKTNSEYQLGSSLPTNDFVDYEPSDDYSLLEGAAAFVRRKRHSPKPEDISHDSGLVGKQKSTINELNGSLPVSSLTDKELVKSSEATTDKERVKEELTDPTNVTYDGPPKRPMEITDSERRSCDVPIDDNTRIVLSLDVFHHSEERAIRLIQANVPQGPGRYQKVCVVITDAAVYLTQYDGTEGVFSPMIGMSYSKLDYILVGLSWQSFSLLYKENVNGIIKNHKQVVITGSEAVSRSIADTIQQASASNKQHPKAISLKRDDDARIEAIEKELIKLGSETSMEIVRYCMVYWEQLSGEPPLLSPPADISIPISGTLSVKEISLFKIQSWNNGYFQLIEGILYHFGSENDKSPKSSYPMRGLKCGGCTRTAGENKDYAFKVVDTNGSSLILAADDEEDMTRWMQALCLATIGEEEAIKSPIQKGGAYCAVLLTQNKIHVLKEDWSNGTVQLVTSISVQDVNEVCVEGNLPVYCTLSYDDWENESQGVWMLCFSSEYELGQFEKSLLKKYKEIFQVDLVFSELTNSLTCSRAHQAIELMRASRNRSDSITRGRTVFTFDN